MKFVKFGLYQVLLKLQFNATMSNTDQLLFLKNILHKINDCTFYYLINNPIDCTDE